MSLCFGATWQWGDTTYMSMYMSVPTVYHCISFCSLRTLIRARYDYSNVAVIAFIQKKVMFYICLFVCLFVFVMPINHLFQMR